MNKIRLGFIAAFAVASTLALAADPGSASSRQDRMDQAYANYRGTQRSSGSDSGSSIRGTARRAGHAIGTTARRTGHAIGNVARKAGHAVGTGMRKTGTAIEHGGEKLQGTSKTSP